MLGTVLRLVAQQALGTGQPAGRRAYLAPKKQAEPQPERATHGAKALPGIQMRQMSPFERAEIVVVPIDQICRYREQLEILGVQRRCPIGKAERPISLRPGTLRVAFTAAFEGG